MQSLETSLHYFLQAVMETSLTQAAEKAYITQQAMSGHIQRLEKHYGVKLFERKPHLHLTPEGQLLFNCQQQKMALEENLKTEFQSTCKQRKTQLRIGMNTARAQIILPEVLQQFYAREPQVELHIRHGEASVLEKLLQLNELDVLLGMNTPQSSMLHTEVLYTTPIYTVTTPPQLEAAGLANLTEQASLPLSMMAGLPFLHSYPDSKLWQIISRHLEANNLQLNTCMVIPDTHTHVQIVRGGYGACFSTGLDLSALRESELLELCVFGIEGLKEKCRLDISWLNGRYLSSQAQLLLQLTRDYFSSISEIKCLYDSRRNRQVKHKVI